MTSSDSDATPPERLASTRRELSRLRHPEAPLRIFAVDCGPSVLAPPQPAGWDHFITLRSGAATVVSNGSRTLLTPDLAHWAPTGTAYALELRARCELRILYAATSDCTRPLDPLMMTPLLSELIERFVNRGYLDPNRAADARLLAVIDDEINSLSRDSAARPLMLPHDARLRAAAERIVTGDERPRMRVLAAAAGMSVRSVERHFAADTGMSARAWLRCARLSRAALALACGASVTDASLACGYSSLSAFIAAYRAVFGTTPGRYRGKRLSRQCGVVTLNGPNLENSGAG